MKLKSVLASTLSVGLFLAVLIQCNTTYGLETGPRKATRDVQSDAIWYFAVSGDSRDCGDLIMPKIAEAIRASKPSVAFYWHLGDYRRMFSTDCDIAKRQNASFDCKNRASESPDALKDYQHTAWDDFIDHQVKPFGDVPVFLSIGNHELIGKTRDDYRTRFEQWLANSAIRHQHDADAVRGFAYNLGQTYYHFVKNDVDFISLDNADGKSFRPAQVRWLMAVLEQDENDPSVKGIIVGMHAALPFSKSATHAMDATCQGICSGQQVYDLLYRAHSIYHKNVYVLASHSHYFQEDIYNTPEHQGRVLPGWIVGTAGAEQYHQTILYGYMLVGVHADGTITTDFKPVTSESAPQQSGPGAEELTSYCFARNKVDPGKAPKKIAQDCVCGAVN